MKKLALILSAIAGPVWAAPGPFISLFNTNFVVILAFGLFVGVIFYLKVPGLLTGLLDKRAQGIRDELNAARALREEAQTILASYERKQKEVAAQAERIVQHARGEAMEAAQKAKDDLKASIERRLAAAQDQILSAQTKAVKELRDSAAQLAIAAASDVIAAKMSAADADALIDDAIKTVQSKLN
ncbi:MAG: F0F1 ATP synthase subunit B [Paracoccaceae bacterium]